MRPLTVVTLIVLGSCFAIMVSLGAVLIVTLVLGDEPRLQREFAPLLRSFCIFVGMTTIGGLSFYSLLKKSRARYWAQAAMWAGILLTGWYYGS